MNASGKFVLRLEPSFHEQLRLQAQEKGYSLNGWIVQCLRSPQAQTQSLQTILNEHYRDTIMGVVLFGSQVRGEARETSDVDLLIVLDDKTSISRELYRTWDQIDFSKEMKKYSPQFSHLPEKDDNPSSLWLEVAIEGLILWDRDEQIQRKLLELRQLISRGEFVRKMSHGHPYWTKREQENAK